MSLAWLSIQFLLCAAAIAVAGFVLSRSADTLAEAYGWGRGWVGLALLATVTSLPELASGVSAVALVGAPDLAVGNALGACVVNLVFLAVVDLLQRGEPLYRRAGGTHLLAAGFGVLMLGFAAMSLVGGATAPQMLGVGLYSPVLLALYLLALRSVFVHEHTRPPGTGPAPRPPAAAVRREWRRFGAAAAVVLAAGTWLPEAADGLCGALGLSQGFVGTVFMALVTTLPEMAVTVSALRLGALDMAVGNLLGSNLFNVLILAIDDLAYTRGPLLADAAPAHAGTAAAALAMTGLVIVGLVLRPRRRVLGLFSAVSLGLLVVYAVNAVLIYRAAA